MAPDAPELPRAGAVEATKKSMYLTANDIAAELQVPLRTAYTYVGQMRHLKIGRNVRVSRASFEAWKRERECAPLESTERTPNAPRERARATQARRRASGLEAIHVSQPRKRRSP